MKTSRIKAINECKEWKGERGSVFYHNLELENGDKINIGKKKPLQVGFEIHYEIIGDIGQHEYTKAKSVNPEFKKSSGYDVKGVQAGHALTGAIYLMTAGIEILKDEELKEIEKLDADKRNSNKLYLTALKVAEITETVKNKL